MKFQVNSNVIAASIDAESIASAGNCQSEEEMAVLTLYDNGLICECNKAAARLLDCVPNKLT
ncbi:MAG: hypothetical protein Q8R23_03795, partial [Methylotenera sp.]|nr:hypothetical protein [Methylotenera sp.]